MRKADDPRFDRWAQRWLERAPAEDAVRLRAWLERVPDEAAVATLRERAALLCNEHVGARVHLPERQAAGTPAAFVSRALDAALERGDAAAAWSAAFAIERGTLSLDYALAIVVLVSTEEPDRYEAAAARWMRRWQADTPGAS